MGDEKIRVETLFHPFRRNPAREIAQRIDVKFEIFGFGKFQHGGVAIIEAVAPAVQFGQTRRRQKLITAFFARQKNTAFLKGLPNTADPHGQRMVVIGVAVANMGAQARLKIGLIDLAARKHQSTRGEVNLMVTHHHKNFGARRRIAGNQNRCGRNQSRITHIGLPVWLDLIAQSEKGKHGSADHIDHGHGDNLRKPYIGVQHGAEQDRRGGG